jgi:CBS-domain-containing membrane protein
MKMGECFYTILGCFVGLLILSIINEIAIKMTDDELNLILGPFGALMTLQYVLPSAPASQPRNVILGQVLAGSISLSFTHIPLGLALL